MAYLKQFFIIASFTFAGELCRHLVPLAIPAGIYGLVLMLAFLSAGILKLESVKRASDYLIEVMPVMFVPGAVGIMKSWHIISPKWAECLTITAVSTFVVMGAAGIAAQMFVKKEDGKDA